MATVTYRNQCVIVYLFLDIIYTNQRDTSQVNLVSNLTYFIAMSVLASRFLQHKSWNLRLQVKLLLFIQSVVVLSLSRSVRWNESNCCTLEAICQLKCVLMMCRYRATMRTAKVAMLKHDFIPWLSLKVRVSFLLEKTLPHKSRCLLWSAQWIDQKEFTLWFLSSFQQVYSFGITCFELLESHVFTCCSLIRPHVAWSVALWL